MPVLMEEVKKLSVSERADLLLALSNDIEVSEYLQTEKIDKILFSEIARRDEAFKNGSIYLTTVDDLTARLKNRRNAV